MNDVPADHGKPSSLPSNPPRILYCHCRYAQVVPAGVKNEVLQQLCESRMPFDAVPDLCELSARKDAALESLAKGGAIKIAACYPRAVKWLFAAAGYPLSNEHAEVLNMRTQTAAEISASLRSTELHPNLPLDHTPASKSASAPASASAGGAV